MGKNKFNMFFLFLKISLVIYFLALELIAVVCTIQRDHIIYFLLSFIVLFQFQFQIIIFVTFYSLINETFWE